MSNEKKRHILRNILFIIGGAFAVLVLIAIFAPEPAAKPEAAATPPEAAIVPPEASRENNDPAPEKYNLVFQSADGRIAVEGFFEGVNLLAHNVSGSNLNRVYISADVWKDNNTDSTYIANIETFTDTEVLEISKWTKLANGRITKNASLPGQGYIIKNIYIDCDEGTFQAYDKMAAQEQAATVVSPIEAAEQPAAEVSLFKSSSEFRTSFNNAAKANNFGYQINNIPIKGGEIRDTFQIMFGSNIGIIGTVNKTNAEVIELSMVGAPDGTIDTTTEIILCMATIMNTIDPSLKSEDKGSILEELKFINSDEGTDIMDLSSQTIRNGIEYSLSTSRYIGIMLSVSRKFDIINAHGFDTIHRQQTKFNTCVDATSAPVYTGVFYCPRGQVNGQVLVINIYILD
jgi:hypothetical protein